MIYCQKFAETVLHALTHPTDYRSSLSSFPAALPFSRAFLLGLATEILTWGRSLRVRRRACVCRVLDDSCEGCFISCRSSAARAWPAIETGRTQSP
jgi:hypothetical protein